MTADADDNRPLARLKNDISAVKEYLRAGSIADARGLLTQMAERISRFPDSQIVGQDFSQWGMAAAVAANDVPLVERLDAIFQPDGPFGRPRAVSPAAPLQDWCGRNGVRCDIIDPPRSVSLPATSPYSIDINYVTDPVISVVLPNGRWIGGWDYAIAPDGTVLIDTCYQAVTSPMAPYTHFYIAALEQMAHYAPAETVTCEGDVLLLSAPHQLHFGHWLVDFLPRLRGLDMAPMARVAVPDDIPEKFYEILALWGLGRDRLILCRRDRQYRFERMHILKSGRALPPHPDHVSMVRAKLRGGKSETSEHAPKRIFAARGNIGTRQIKNWPEVQAVLDEKGFFEIDMTDLSIDDQRTLMIGAEVIVGVYGSNLFALYFAPPACTVIALMPEGMNDPAVAHTCAIFGMHHQFLNCAIDAGGTGRRVSQIIVDIEALRARLSAYD